MRLRRLDLLRYGHFTGNSFELLPDAGDFHVLFGPNEAGKSTVLSAIEDLLFGVPTKSRYAFLHDYANLRVGALLEHGQEVLEVVRRKGLKDTLLGPDGLPLAGGESQLRRFLAGADRAFFERMFSLDHRRLEAGGRAILEARDEIGQTLFAAGAGMAGLRERIDALSQEADGLWTPRKAKHRQYYQADDRRQEAEKVVRQHTETAAAWQERKRARDSAEQEYVGIEGEYERVSAERKRLGRIRRVYGDVRRKAELDKQIADLGAVILLPEAAGQLFEEAERKEADAATRIEVDAGRLAKARKELDALTYDAPLVRRADDINQVNEQRIEVRGERIDLPKRRAELNAAETDLRGLAGEMGWGERDLAALTARIPDRIKVHPMRSLLAGRGALESALNTASATLEEAEAAHAELEKRLEAMTEATDISRLEAVITTVRERGDVTGRVRRAEQQAAQEQDRIDSLLASMRPPADSTSGLLQIPAPSRSRVQQHRDSVQDWERRTRDTARQLAAKTRDLERARKRVEDAARHERTVSPEEIDRARGDRDRIWEFIRRKYVDQVSASDDEAPPSADLDAGPAKAFESAMHAADTLADRRFETAEAAARVAEQAGRVNEQEEDLAQLQKEREAGAQEGGRLRAEWQAMWDSAPFDPLEPDVMLEWLDMRDASREAMARQADAASELATQRSEEHESRGCLITELSELGIDRGAMEGDTVPILLERAERVRQEHTQRVEDRTRLEKGVEEAVTTIGRRRREHARAREAWSDWQKRWLAALTGLGLASDTHPDEVATRLDVVDQMRENARVIKDLREKRINKIERDIDALEANVAALVKELAGDLSGMAADEAAVGLKERLEEALRRRALRGDKEKEIQAIEKDLRAREDERQQAHGSVDHLKAAASARTNEELRQAIERSNALRVLQGELQSINERLARDGDDLTVADLEAECADIDIDRIAAAEETTEVELKTLRDRLALAAEVRSKARDAFRAIGGNDAAARAAADCQAALTDLREVAARYVRVRTSELLLRWAIDRYRRRKQAPMLKRAGELFAINTGGSFTDLQVEFDEQDAAHLTGLRSSGDAVRVSGMSSGTADQLYLALRVASIEDYLARADALPFVADDLFINFDDERAAAGLEMLGGLARTTQVLFFTHHQHLVDIARKTLGSSLPVHTLGPA